MQPQLFDTLLFMNRRQGFTLIELMLVVAILGILSSVALPKFANLVGRARDASVKGRLGGLRSAMTIFYSDHEGKYPIWTSGPDYTYGGLVPTYINPLPICETNAHLSSTIFALITDYTAGPDLTSPPNHQGTWMYVGDANWKNDYGRVWIPCTHPDSSGTPYSTY